MKVKIFETEIFVRTTFVGYHNWPEAPEEVDFLRNRHRHVFHVEVHFPIIADRQLEFFIMKRVVNEAINFTFPHDNLNGEFELGENSCENICLTLEGYLTKYNPTKIIVSEDNENGSILYREVG